MLERVDRRVVDRGVVEKRDVPDVEVDRPERQRDERMREHAQLLDRPQRQHGPEHRPGQTRDEAERRQIAQQDVLTHVDEEEVLLAERVDRRVERHDHERDPEPEEELAPARHRLPAPREGAAAPQVGVRGKERGHELERLEVPAGCDGGDRQGNTVWTMPPCTSSTTTS